MALGRDTTMCREILDNTVERIAKDLTGQPEVEVELCLTLADTYRDLGLFIAEHHFAEGACLHQLGWGGILRQRRLRPAKARKPGQNSRAGERQRPCSNGKFATSDVHLETPCLEGLAIQ